jgi:hypothetical protein
MLFLSKIDKIFFTLEKLKKMYNIFLLNELK